jgi:hypothetical protein
VWCKGVWGTRREMIRNLLSAATQVSKHHLVQGGQQKQSRLGADQQWLRSKQSRHLSSPGHNIIRERSLAHQAAL